MTANAQWMVEGREKASDNLQILYLVSPDLKSAKEARRRAAVEAKRRWAKKGLKVDVTAVSCVG